MRNTITTNAAATMVFALLPLAASAAPVEWPVSSGGNGHYYEVIAADGLDWNSAEAAVVSPINIGPVGLKGYLATLTTPAENTHVDGLRIASGSNKTGFANSELWIGGFQDPPSSATGDGWTWVNNEGPISVFYWLPGEPNDAGGSESHLAIGWSGHSGWNDEAHLGGIYGYVVEYEVVVSAADDTAEASSGVPKNIDVIGNDTVSAGVASVTIETPPASGNSASVGLDFSVDYEPDSTFEGTDTFQYRVTDVNGAYAIATVTVEVSAAVAIVIPGPNQLIFNQAMNPTPSSPNPLTAAYQQVLSGGQVEISCCLVLDTREDARRRGRYLPIDFDIGEAIAVGDNPTCYDIKMANDIPMGTAVMKRWHRGVPESKGIYDSGDPVIAREHDLGVCVIKSLAEADGVVFSAEQAKNVLGYKLNYQRPRIRHRPFTAGVAVSPVENDTPYVTPWTADTDESRSAKKYSTNVMVLNVWHSWWHKPTRPYLSRLADSILDSIDDARMDGVDNDFLDDLKLLMLKAKIRIWIPWKANEAVATLEDATRLALLIGPDAPTSDPYLGSTSNWKGLWTGRTMALKFAACSELLHPFSSSSTLDGACLIADDILDEMPDLPGF